jgi:hypothetical protein
MRLWTAFLLIALLVSAQKGPLFSDEFNGGELDLAKWVPHDPWADARTPDLASVSAGELHLRQGQTITTFGLFSQKYGRFEARVRAQAGKGRFRLLPLPLAHQPAIDVFAFEGQKVSFGNFWGTEQTERAFADSFDAPGSGWHAFRMEWESGKIVWSIDGKERMRSTDGVPEQAMFLLLEGPLDLDYVRVN